MNAKIVEKSILYHTNRARKRHGLQPLKGHRSLIKSARSHSRWMARHNRYHHTGVKGTRPYERARYHGFPSDFVGENIFCKWVKGRGPKADWKLGEEAVRGWMNSPGHRSNILHNDYKRIGIGVARRRGQVYLTQNFGDAGLASSLWFHWGIVVLGWLAIAGIILSSVWK